MATSSTYCTARDLKDIYPNIDEFDTKTAVYGWELSVQNKYDSVIDLYYAVNTGVDLGDIIVTGRYRVLSKELQHGMKVSFKIESNSY